MSRQIECPRCGIRVQSKFVTDPNKRPRHVGELRYCPVCGVRLRLVRSIYGTIKGAEVVDGERLQPTYPY